MSRCSLLTSPSPAAAACGVQGGGDICCVCVSVDLLVLMKLRGDDSYELHIAAD